MSRAQSFPDNRQEFSGESLDEHHRVSDWAAGSLLLIAELGRESRAVF